MANKKAVLGGRRLVRYIEQILKPLGKAEFKFSRRRGPVLQPGFEVRIFGDDAHVFYWPAKTTFDKRDERLAEYKDLLEKELSAGKFVVQLSDRRFLPSRVIVSPRSRTVSG